MKKILKIVCCVIIALVLLFIISWQFDFTRSTGPVWGTTFSEYYAKDLLKIDWQKTYEVILTELNFRKLRLIAYWEYLEPNKGEMDFKDLDWQVSEAGKLGKKIILALGYRVPRWPECHSPEWIKQENQSDFEGSLLDYIKMVINHYKDNDSIEAWQVENEPFVSTFGGCPPLDVNLFKEEIALVKSIDPTRPVIVTDSGELSLWTRAAQYGDVLGTTLYRFVWNSTLGKFKHFIPPAFYTWRAWLVEKLFHTKDVIISELQAEPWATNNASVSNIAFEHQTDNLSLDDFKNIVDFAKKTGIQDIYLWGPEWWYYRQLNGDPSWMEFGKTIK